uniref:Folate-biopterin transporter n=1 Tax=Pyramimonas obovata TaxID=1411642 RepID=A0A7S0MRD9_9CHLO|mmetsp:Transcript_11394/g.23818  ORF Transcript_11394/g.23818 Transcript_11394/m.23818 type:complete len:567 (+) Transcript_11394:83-1783(+)|eukprot:CAMPEP_0118934216 /NCGR_PEP_ID=MMETSP1169-20130426/13699_1 /TAXON_ID=36882 /ORGANISM="Pyramimonas obovata, Strain CCMP722" /LENGTH=566 /DNA_ID=CAMNT_0006877093 /DNA_START=67 /DNA_END=1767 /DNA_ORIENTATION=-
MNASCSGVVTESRVHELLSNRRSNATVAHALPHTKAACNFPKRPSRSTLFRSIVPHNRHALSHPLKGAYKKMPFSGLSAKGDKVDLVRTVDEQEGLEVEELSPVDITIPILKETKQKSSSEVKADGTLQAAYESLSNVSPEIAAIILVYFVQGVLGLSRLAVSFFLKDELHISPSMMTVLTGISTIPWLVKPLWGFLSDSVPLFGYRRRSYLFLCGLIGAAGWAGMATAVNEPKAAVACLTLAALGTAASDVVVDSIVVERARGEDQGKAGQLQSICWASAAVGGLASAYFSGSLVQNYGTRFVFGVTAALPLLTAGTALLVDEKRLPKAAADSAVSTLALAKEQGLNLWKAAKQRSIWVPTIFVFLWQATPSADSAMFYFTTNQLDFSAEFLGRVRLVTSLASLVGIGLYNFKLKDVPLKKMFFWTAVTGTALGLTQLALITGYNRELGIPDEYFAMGDSLILTVLGQLAFMPTLVLAAKICPDGLEATLFAGLMSVFNAGGVASGALGAGLTELLGVTAENFDNLALLVTICNLSSLLPLPFLFLLNDVATDSPSEEELATKSE